MSQTMPEVKPLTCAQTIREITRRHLLENNGLALGQCLTAVGWVGGTVPELTAADGLVEMSMDDTSSSYIAVGYALAGRRPIYIVRYQGFQFFNCIGILNYAAKSKALWNIPCPVFVRSIAMEGGIGPVAGNSHHGLYTRMPGMAVYAPMTPGEYCHIWQWFIEHDDPVYVSEHRKSFSNAAELPDRHRQRAALTVFAISAARFNAQTAVERLALEGIECNLIHLTWLKPLRLHDNKLGALASSHYGGLVLDTDYENGVAKCIAYDLMQATARPVCVLGLAERTAGFAPQLDNLPPSVEQICVKVKQLLES